MFLIISICLAIVVLLGVVAGVLHLRKRKHRRRFVVPVENPQDGAYAPAEWREYPHAANQRATRSPRLEDAPEPYELQLPDHPWPARVESLSGESQPPAVVDPEAAAAQELDRQRRGRWDVRRRKLQEREEIRYQDDGDLDRGLELGAGGQGAVYELIENTDQVAKYWASPLDRGLREFEELVHRRSDVEVAISGNPIRLCWPDSPIRKDGRMLGYTMPRIADQFYFTMNFGSISKKKLRELQHALPRNAAANQFPFEVEDRDRFELVYLVAVFLDGMHRNDIVYGDFSWMNFTFSLKPVELCVLDFDSSRVQGSLPFTRGLPLDSPDWDDPQWHGSVVARMDSDRYKFALFAYRMLVAKDLYSPIDGNLAADWAIASGAKVLGNLWIRSLDAAGTRPQLTEWVLALEEARASAGVRAAL